jgi:UvrB interaction domain
LSPDILAPPRQAFSATPGKMLAMDGIVAWLELNGYTRASTVREAGEYAVRGGLIDLFPPGQPEPVRLDLFGDTHRFANPKGLIAYIKQQGREARVRPDMKVVFFHDWDEPEDRQRPHRSQFIANPYDFTGRRPPIGFVLPKAQRLVSSYARTADLRRESALRS